MDVNNDGVVSREEFEKAMQAPGEPCMWSVERVPCRTPVRSHLKSFWDQPSIFSHVRASDNSCILRSSTEGRVQECLGLGAWIQTLNLTLEP